MSRDPVQRVAFIVLPVAVIGLVGWVTSESVSFRPRMPVVAIADAGAEAGTPDAGVMEAGGPVIAVTEELDSGLALSLAFDAALPVDMPKRIRVGIVLVTFAGADGAGSNARPKAAALTLAKKLAEDAKTDFKAAVKAGDPGSDADFGRLERGILASEPQAEAAVFGLEPGAVSDVVETSRGFWIVKRID